MIFSDALTMDAPRRTGDGYVVVRARAARTGVYQYAGAEVDPLNKHGLRDAETVNVLRDESQVFDASSMRSFVGKPVTDNHPSARVTSANWRDHARGVIMGAVRDGEYVAFDILLTDAEAIAKIEAGKRELSNGYGADLQFGDFTAPDGTACQARQTTIKGNHVALVDKGRAGPACAIMDSVALCDANVAAIAAASINTGDKRMKTLTIDGLIVPNVSDEAAAAISKLQATAAEATAKLADAEAKIATIATEKATADARVATLEAKLADSALTPAQLRDAARSYAITADRAKSLGVEVTDTMDEPAMMAAAVKLRLGDVAKDWTDAQIAASFATLAKDAAHEVRSIPAPALISDARSLEDQAWRKSAAAVNAWRTK